MEYLNANNIKIGDLVKIKHFEDEYCTVTKICNDEKIFVESEESQGFFPVSDILEVRRPCQYKTIYKKSKPILDDKEKEYLSAVIKPFRNKISVIAKVDFYEKQYICISLKNEADLCLPNFKRNVMYNGMKANKEYTLNELGL